MVSAAPIRSRAPEEGDFQIPLWSVPLILVILYVCLFSGLGALGLVGPDEPRYAAIARAMAETGDWVTPRLWGTPWFEKPVLYYWAAGISMRLFGVSEFAARLPSALAALLAVVSVAWTALRSFGVRAAWFSLLMLPTSVAMIGFSRAASPDMLFAGLLTASMAIAVEILQKQRPGAGLRIAFGFSLGAAVLAKGPAAVILAGGATLLWAALSRQWLAAFRFLHPLIIAVFCATALPWYILCALRNPDFLRVFIWQHNFERYLTPVFEHRQPFWYYGPILLLAIFPWILFLVWAIPDAVKCFKTGAHFQSPTLFFASWAAFPVLFFSLSQSKLPGYIVPAIPPLFALLGNRLSHLLQNSTNTAQRLLGWTGALFLFLSLPLLAEIVVGIRNMDRPEYALAGGVAFVVGSVVTILAFKKQPTAALLGVVLLIALCVLAANVVVLPRLDSRISARPLARKMKEADPTLSHIATYDLSRNWTYGLNFYFNQQLPEWTRGSGEPEWILGGSMLDRTIERRYDIGLDELTPENRDLIFVFHHF
ncbi:MAG: glycosyltransferase family 39 protein [Acidobacteriia bacterium]|nr:glycosyltransferase family 39 protein [Terriglobia bacterium]